MRRAWILAVPILLLAAAVSGEPSKPSTSPAICPAASASAADHALAQSQPAPRLMTDYLCGSCSGDCSGLLTGSSCAGGDGVCLGIVSPTGQRARCLAPDTGYACTCTA